MPTDLPAAARRLADLARAHGDRDGYPNMRDLVAVLPWLDAAGAEPGGDRVERWTVAVRAACEHGSSTTISYRRIAESLAALADAERAASAAEGWQAYEAAVETMHLASAGVVNGADPFLERFGQARAALDAAVRRLAGIETKERINVADA